MVYSLRYNTNFYIISNHVQNLDSNDIMNQSFLIVEIEIYCSLNHIEWHLLESPVFIFTVELR